MRRRPGPLPVDGGSFLASPVFPGEALTIEMWVVADGESIFHTRGEDGRVVLAGGRHTFDA